MRFPIIGEAKATELLALVDPRYMRDPDRGVEGGFWRRAIFRVEESVEADPENALRTLFGENANEVVKDAEDLAKKLDKTLQEVTLGIIHSVGNAVR